MLNFEKVFSQIKKSVENDFLEVPYRLHSICFVVKARKYIAFLFVAVEVEAETCASGMVYGAT